MTSGALLSVPTFERWQLGDFAAGEGSAAGAATPEYADGEWLDVAVPGDVHSTLIAAGRIPDPFFDQNEKGCAWVEEREWWYRVRFAGPAAPAAGERLQLVFHGLDTFATIWLNGAELGHHQNMFRPAIFDVTGSLRDGANTLAVRFDPPLRRIAGMTLSQWGRNPERVAMRKAQFGYGWDWGPRLPTVGIWRPVELRRQREAAISGVHFSTVDLAPGHRQAAVAVRVTGERFAGAGPLAAHIQLVPPDGAAAVTYDLALHPGPGGTDGSSFDGTAYLAVDNPRLWWTHDLGDPALSSLSVTLRGGGGELDRHESRVGIRTLTLDQSPDPVEPGTRFFRFVLNGVPIFARGADWIPCDSFVGAIPRERYATLLAAARDANMTMVRVWGGGIYEHDAFYDLCDQLGLLVWQDLMFACAMYPEDDPGFVAEVDAEARYQVARLRGHACLALWCGNNENQWIHDRTFWDRGRDKNDPPPYGALYYDTILPAAVAELDGRTPYWPGSPFGGNDHNSREEGNVHNWEVWHGNFPRRFGEQPRREPTPENVSFVRYADDMGRFISEFGMHASPVLETLRRAIPEDQLYHHSPAMDWHNKDNPKNKGDNLMQGVTGLPRTLEEYIAFSQIAQAEGLKFGIEHFRRRKPHCSGTLVWQLNDCWPVLSWSVLDYFGSGKAGYYYLRRVFSPVLASFKALPDGSVELWLTNDTLDDVVDTAVVRLQTFAGETLWERQCPVRAPANASGPVLSLSRSDAGSAVDRYLGVRSAGERFRRNRHFFAPIKDLRRPPSQVQVSVTPVSAAELRVDLRAPADAYAFFVHLAAAGGAAHFSDNYFDLEPGESQTVTATAKAGSLTPEAVTVAWR